jgi:hypothetical protein
MLIYSRIIRINSPCRVLGTLGFIPVINRGKVKSLMRKSILLILVFFCYNSANPQSQADVSYLDLVKTLVCDSGSAFFYPKLLDKIKKHPGEINENDVKYLYYGQVFRIGYEPRKMFDDDRKKLEKYMGNDKKYKVIELGTEILKNHPVDLTTLLYTCKCLMEKKLPDTTYFLENRYRMLLKGILSTGNGTSKESAIVVASIWDEYIIKGVLGFTGGNDILLGSNNFGSYCAWDTPKGKIYFLEIYPLFDK